MDFTVIQSIGYLTLFYSGTDTSRIYYTDSRLGMNHGPFFSSNAAVEHWTKLTHPMIKEYTTSKPVSMTDSDRPGFSLKDHSFTESGDDNKVIHVDFINKVRIK